jgi:hypothetical protein
MTWSELLAQKRVVGEPASAEELHSLQAVVRRSLADAALPRLSTDGRFAMAYNAARTLAAMVVRAAGYRVKPTGGGHVNTFLALATADLCFADWADYFDLCRRKRNDLSYVGADLVSASEAAELIERVQSFKALVEVWLAQHHPGLLGAADPM